MSSKIRTSGRGGRPPRRSAAAPRTPPPFASRTRTGRSCSRLARTPAPRRRFPRAASRLRARPGRRVRDDDSGGILDDLRHRPERDPFPVRQAPPCRTSAASRRAANSCASLDFPIPAGPTTATSRSVPRRPRRGRRASRPLARATADEWRVELAKESRKSARARARVATARSARACPSTRTPRAAWRRCGRGRARTSPRPRRIWPRPRRRGAAQRR